MSDHTRRPEARRGDDIDAASARRRMDRIQYALFAIAAISVLAAIGHAIAPGRVDQVTAMFLALAVVAVTFQQVTKFKGFGVELERRVENLSEAMAHLEKEVGPGSQRAVGVMPPSEAAVSGAAPAAVGVDPDDPNRGRFGGSPEANGRKLSATITPMAGPTSATCRVRLAVTSTDPSRPLEGKVRLHLHPTFGRWSSYEIDARGGVAEDVLTSYGAFTIGAEADGGATRLELDLMNVPGGTARFYES